MIGGRRPLAGRKLADRRVRVERPHAPYFRYTGPGQLVAREAASRPTTPTGRLIAKMKAVAIGRPLASEEEIGERLSISPRTAEVHRANLMRKLGLHNQAELVRYAIRRGILSEDN